MLTWAHSPEVRGVFVIAKDIPRNWLFGPYVTEVRVDWEEDVRTHPGSSATKILQSAQFYDYFLVAPPDALDPPSPIYDVHLVTWFDDWR